MKSPPRSAEDAARDREKRYRLAMRQRAALYEINRSFSDLTDLDRLLPVVIAKAKEALGAESCAILLHDADAEELYFPYVADIDPDVERRFAEIRFPAGQGIAGWVLEHDQVELVPDVSRDPRWYANVDGQSGMVTHSLLCAPLHTQRGVIGVVELRNKLEGEFAAADLDLIRALAESIAVAIDNAQRYGSALRSATKLHGEVAALQREIARCSQFEDIVGQSPAMQRVFHLMESAVSSPVTVLIRGETGTGKELIARAIHYHGPRRERPFVAINCGALSETLLESELFGHTKGSFTGALNDKQGLFEVADGGTIFLDEVGDTPAAMQAKLLRVLQEGEFLPIGQTSPRHVDVRLISATNRNLNEAIDAGEMRRDLYYRISTFPIDVPPLRERSEDIPVLAARLLERTAEKFQKAAQTLSAAALDALARHDWPGNVRELQNEIERAVALVGPRGVIEPQHLSAHMVPKRAVHMPVVADAMTLRQARDLFEKEYIAQVLAQHDGNATRAAKVLSISRVMLQNRIRDYGLRKRTEVR